MRIVVNTESQSAGVKPWVEDLVPRLRDLGFDVTRNDWQGYDGYDVAMFLAQDQEVRRANAQNPDGTTVVVDPKLDGNLAETLEADLLVVSSIEQKDAFLRYHDEVFIYPPFPEWDYDARKTHEETAEKVIGYHGNKNHLEHFEPRITEALERLGERHDITLKAIYNVEQLGRWEVGVPDNVTVEHVQWSPECYSEELATCDVGIANYFIPLPPRLTAFLAQYPSLEYLTTGNGRLSQTFERRITRRYHYDEHDQVLRYKYTSNPGRLYPFGRVGVPVVADYTPSNARVIAHGESGYLARTSAAWEHYLERLLTSPERRRSYSRALEEALTGRFSVDRYAADFADRLEDVVG